MPRKKSSRAARGYRRNAERELERESAAYNSLTLDDLALLHPLSLLPKPMLYSLAPALQRAKKLGVLPDLMGRLLADVASDMDIKALNAELVTISKGLRLFKRGLDKLRIVCHPVIRELLDACGLAIDESMATRLKALMLVRMRYMPRRRGRPRGMSPQHSFTRELLGDARKRQTEARPEGDVRDDARKLLAASRRAFKLAAAVNTSVSWVSYVHRCPNCQNPLPQLFPRLLATKRVAAGNSERHVARGAGRQEND